MRDLDSMEYHVSYENTLASTCFESSCVEQMNYIRAKLFKLENLWFKFLPYEVLSQSCAASWFHVLGAKKQANLGVAPSYRPPHIEVLVQIRVLKLHIRLICPGHSTLAIFGTKN